MKIYGMPHVDLYPVPVMPHPSELPPGAFVVDQRYNGRIGRINHDLVPRSPGFLTNEIEALRKRRSDGLKVDPNSKVTWRLGDSPAWMSEFDRLNGTWVADRLRTEKIGWYDTGFPVFSMLDCGGNLVVGIDNGNPFEFLGWMAIQYQRFQSGPQGYNYNEHPYLVTKQTLVAGKDTTRILIDKGYPGGYGDAFLPKVAPEQLYVSTIRRDKPQNGVRMFPPLPWETKLHRVPVTVTRMAFYGSNTYVEVDGQWHLGEEMLVIGDYFDDPSRGGTMDDRRTYCDALLSMPCPPPVIGWTRQAWYIMLLMRFGLLK